MLSFDTRGLIEAIESTVAKTFDRKIADIKNLSLKNYANKEWLTEDEAADFLGVEKTTVQKLRRDGKLAGKKKGKKSYFHINDIKAYIESDED